MLERYVESDHADVGIALVMTDMKRFVHPKSKAAKCWRYDISDNAEFGPINLDTPIGGKPVSIRLQKKYKLNWIQHGEFWFLEMEGKI